MDGALKGVSIPKEAVCAGLVKTCSKVEQSQPDWCIRE